MSKRKPVETHPWLILAMQARPGEWQTIHENKFRLVEKELDVTIGPVNVYHNQMTTMPISVRRNGRFVDVEMVRNRENIKCLMSLL
jgi:hypothetical protein